MYWIEKKIEENLLEDQFGFQRNLGPWEAIWSLRVIMEKPVWLKEIMIAFVGITKAFDNINWIIVFKVFIELKVDYGDRRIILKFYKK